MANLNSSKALLQIAERSLSADLAQRQGRTDEAVRAYREGIVIEDNLVYDEPTAWALPLRQQLGAVLLAAKRNKDAEQAFREDLVRSPTTAGRSTGSPRRSARRGGPAKPTRS